jgi:prophage antirepressor-like protein
MKTYKILIAVDNPEAEAFATWLEQRAHLGKISNSTGNYVVGIQTSSDAKADEIVNSLWADYCNS